MVLFHASLLAACIVVVSVVGCAAPHLEDGLSGERKGGAGAPNGQTAEPRGGTLHRTEPPLGLPSDTRKVR